LPLKKLVCEPKFKLRIFLQITDCADPKALCFAASHHQRVCIVEAQRSRRANAKFLERIPNLIYRNVRIAHENLRRDCSRIFGISVDLSVPKRFPEYDRTAHSLAMFRWNSRVG